MEYQLQQTPIRTRKFGWHPEMYGIGKWQSTDIEWYSGYEQWVSILCLN